MIGKHDKICRLTVKLLRNFRKKAFLSALQDNKQPNLINTCLLLIYTQMTHPFRTSILIYEQSKICHFWQCDWLIFVYAREKLAELTNQSKILPCLPIMPCR